MKAISRFTGGYEFLSNFYPCKVMFEGAAYLSAESAFQAAKCAYVPDRARFLNLSASEAKRLGRKITLRWDWEGVKVDVMCEVVRSKFSDNPELGVKLAETGDAMLIEGNNWHDNFWGDCSCERCVSRRGENALGKILMACRDDLLGR